MPNAEALLSLAGAETLSLRDAADDPVFEPEPSTAPLWPNVTVEALFPSGVDAAPLLEMLKAAFPNANALVETFEESEWQARLPRPVAARAIGKRLWLAPADDANVPSDRRIVRINMGLAFGTGEHPTTALCLDWLERHVVEGTTVLDYGCGSGILALAALKLGARFAYAVDNDPQALTATAANAVLNGEAESLFIGAPELLPAAAVDVLVANILADPLVEHAPTFAERLMSGGVLVLSGILVPQAERVAAAYEPYLDELVQAERDGWVRLTGRRTRVKSAQNR